MQVRLTAHSQSHRLRERMEEAGVRHGQEVRADVRGVRVELTTPEWFTRWDKIKADVFFCAVAPSRCAGWPSKAMVGHCPTGRPSMGCRFLMKEDTICSTC